MRSEEGLSQPGTHDYTWFLPLLFITYQFLFAARGKGMLVGFRELTCETREHGKHPLHLRI